MPSCRELLEEKAQQWQRVVQPRFLQSCKDGSLSRQQFSTWLGEDFKFVQQFARFAGSLLSKAEAAGDLEVLAGGVGALADELRWFKGVAAEQGLVLDAPPHPACERYIQYLRNCGAQPFAVQAVAFWAIERAYCEGWRSHRPMQQPYEEYAQRWGSDEFSSYVDQLERLADAALECASRGEREEAGVAFAKVCDLETDFWDMAFTAGAV